MQFLTPQELEFSPVVANCTMNRERQLMGVNSYERELGLDILSWLRGFPPPICWADLCCGTGRALVDAAIELERTQELGNVHIEGIDLVGAFMQNPLPDVLALRKSGIEGWEPTDPYALVTCVHGLHYVGDKLAAIAKAVTKLQADGLFVANLDLKSFRYADGRSAGRSIAAQLRKCGFSYDTRQRLLRCSGPRTVDFGWRYLGANAEAGANYTGQAAVDSYYELES
jgi:SAM-dependent methyltransferase